MIAISHFPERRPQRGRGRPPDPTRHLRHHVRALSALRVPTSHRAGNILVLQVSMRVSKINLFVL